MRFREIALPAAGFLALCWFLLRVLPKPSRAAYPCQRAAFPMATSFLIWLGATLGARWALKHARASWRSKKARDIAGAAILAGLAISVWTVSQPGIPAWAANEARFEHAPIGEGQGVHPGRVVWVHAPDAVDWTGKGTKTLWMDPVHTNNTVVTEMAQQAICQLAGKSSVKASWDTIFRNFNEARGRGDTGYKTGEKITIKLNLTLTNATAGAVDDDYNRNFSGSNYSLRNNGENSPQVVLAIVRQLVYEAGVAEEDICLTDPVCIAANFMWNVIHPEFPDIVFADNRGTMGRRRVEFSDERFYWSDPAAEGKYPDYIPDCYAEATYLINMAVLKSHSGGGITVCAKNHYGSFLRTPTGHLRDIGNSRDYYNMHDSLPSFARNGMGNYRTMVDIMGHPGLGQKTVLYLIDGLIGGRSWKGDPEVWDMAPFDGQWPMSLFVSMDPVAIDSVAYDFLLAEWPEDVDADKMVGAAEDYLHEAALAYDPPSKTIYDPAHTGVPLESLGVHEHWNNVVDKQYSRNLGYDYGIELVPVTILDKLPDPGPQLTLQPTGADLLIYVRDLNPGHSYLVESIDMTNGTTSVIESLTPDAYGVRTSIQPSTPTAFFRIHEIP